MNINNSSTVVSNATAITKGPERSNTKSKEVDIDTQQTEQLPAVEPAENANKAVNAERVASGLKQEQLAKESEQSMQEKVETAIENIRGFIQENQRALDFDVAHESNRVIISVIDRQTNEVIRQIPPEDAIELSERIKRGDDITTSGLLLEGKA